MEGAIMTEYRNLLDVLTEGRTLPDGYDSWAIKSTRPDLTTKNGYQWPFPGNATEFHALLDHDSSCPREPGDGVCVALDWHGMASGGFPARTLLLVAYRSVDARGDDSGKMRVSQAFVVALVDGESFVRKNGAGADLYGANLYGANLYGADLYGANLYGANLYGANLYGANLPLGWSAQKVRDAGGFA
jgi:hypothetical protein